MKRSDVFRTISGRLVDAAGSAVVLRQVALASVVANVAVVVTGGAVRLTGSGLGCPTWPRCTDDSYVATPQMGVYGMIEFGNRLLAFGVGLVAVTGFLVALAHRHRGVLPPAVLAALGIPAQAVVGGLTVLTDLNPWVVGGHFLASMAVIAAAYEFWRRSRADDGDPGTDGPGIRGRPGQVAGRRPPPPLRALVWLVTATSAAVLVVGTVVTGSGPHAGDAGARRTGLDPESISQLHTDLVFLLIGLSTASWLALRAVDAPTAAVRAAGLLLLAELGQGAVGFTQYLTGLPPLLVGLHMLGASGVWLATVALLRRVTASPPQPPPAPIPRDHAPARAQQHSSQPVG